MAKNNNLTDFLTDLADGIREVDGTIGVINPQDFRTHINNMVVLSNIAQEKSCSITQNGTTEVIADEGYLLSKVTINTDIKQKYCLVRWYNDDRTTLLYETYVPYGGNAMYAGDAPISTNIGRYEFTEFVPSTANVTEDMSCYAVYEELPVPLLEDSSWEEISTYSETGVAANYFAIGDTKTITLQGKIGTVTVNQTVYVYIIGFNHNSEFEGNGIHFGTFKSTTSNGTDICIVDLLQNTTSQNGTKYFNMSHWGSSIWGGWAGCDLRYDILGSTDVAPSDYGAAPSQTRVGYDASTTCATNPVTDTLMAALPSELRAVMKPMIKYTDNFNSFGDNVETNVTATIDYLPLLAEFEVFGTRIYANSYEQNKQAQYAYYAEGNSRGKYSYLATSTGANWGLRSVSADSSYANFCTVETPDAGAPVRKTNCRQGRGLAPIFKV